MALLIDGYNLMFAAGLIPRGPGPGTLERARHRLLDYLVRHLPAGEVHQTVVVFDAKDAPRDAGAEQTFRGLRVLFARDHAEADDLIEELLRHDSAPRQLILVSSDVRLRTAAQRRRAKAIKSEDWLDQIERRLASSSSEAPLCPSENRRLRRSTSLNDEEVAAWLEEFGLEKDSPPQVSPAEPPAAATQAPANAASPDTPSADIPLPDGLQDSAALIDRRGREGLPGQERRHASLRDDGWAPFPPGYGEDLLSEREDES